MKFSIGSIKLKKFALLHDLAKENRLLDEKELKQEEEVLLKLTVIRKQEELYWKQRFRLQLLKEGDDNTSFFHAVANGHKNRNFIPSISHNGELKTDPKEIGKAFSNRFYQRFGLKNSSRFKTDFRKLLANKTRVDLSQLERPFTLEEIKSAMFDLEGIKHRARMAFPCSFLDNSGRQLNSTSSNCVSTSILRQRI